MTRTLPLLGLFLLLLASCKKDGAIPAYVQLDQPVVVGDNGQLISSKITDAWIYVNDQPAGVWEPGKLIPLIGAGPSTVKVVAGVRKDGIADHRIQYPFYATWQQEVNLVPEQSTVIQPEISYYSGLEYWLADFDTGLRFDTLECTASMVLVPSDSTLIGQGLGNGRISLDSTHPLYRGVSSGDPFTNTGSVAFLEVDYRGDTPLTVGIVYSTSGNTTAQDYLELKATKQADGSMPWNKVYIDLGTPWNIPGALNKRFFIAAALAGGATTGTVDVDNIKLVKP